MSDRDDLAELVGSARTVTKCPSFYFNGRIRYETKGEKLEERLLCMDAVRVYICLLKIPVKIESQFNILAIKLIDRVTDSHVVIELDEKQIHAFHGLQERSSLQPFLIVLIRNLHAVFPHRLPSIIDIRPENEYEKLFRLSNEYSEEMTSMSSVFRPCGGFSLRYECACDLYQIQCHRPVQNLIDTVFAHRLSREFTFRELEPLMQKDWLPILTALRHNEWFRKITIENIKLSSENIEELCHVTRLCKTIRDLRLINCGLRLDFCTKFAHCLSVAHLEHLDLSNNAIEDKGLTALCSSLAQRKQPLRSINLQSCSITHKSLQGFHTALTTNSYLLKHLQILNLSGNRIKEESCLTLLFSNPDNVLEELHISDMEFSLESFLHSLATVFCKLHRLFISSIKPSSSPSSITGGVKLFFTKIQSLEILQLSNANLSIEFLRELCDGLQSNIRLNQLDLRLPGNPLESFIRDYAARFASIPSLIALDITGCDVDNEISTLLNELKKNRKLKSLHLGRNFNNVKAKYIARTINAMKELIWENTLEYLSIADSKLKENLAEILMAVTENTSLQILDIRGNNMGDASVRVLTRILRINRHLHTIYYDRNMLSLNNLEEIVDAMKENVIIQYLPVPITDIILMKTTEKERMEKLQQLLTELDAICTRNQHNQELITSNDSLKIIPAANLTREISLSWENHQQLIGDQATLDYLSSCANRSNWKSEELNSILTRPARITKVAAQLHEFYLAEEDKLQEQWKDLCQGFEEKLHERNERLSRKCYQLFKEQTQIPYDDKFQEQIRSFSTHSNQSIDQLLTKEIPTRLATYSRQCYIDLVTCLQKRAYDTNNDMFMEMHKQLDSVMFPMNTNDGQSSTSTSTIDRLVSRGTNVINRIVHKPVHTQPELIDELAVHRPLRKTDSTECLEDRSPNPVRPAVREPRLLTTTQSKGPAPTSPKPPPSAASSRRSMLVTNSEQESFGTPANVAYSNFHVKSAMKTTDTPMDDEGDLIEHDLLDLVEQEQQKDQQQHREPPPAIPQKKRAAPTAQDNNLDMEVETTTKLVHPGRDRPRRANVTRPVRRATNGGSHDSSSDGGLDNDEPSGNGNSLPSMTNEPSTTIPTVISSADSQTNELPVKAVAKLLKPSLKTSKTSADEAPLPTPVPVKHQPTPLGLQARPSTAASSSITMSLSKSMSTTAHDPSQIINSDSSHEILQSKQSMSASAYGGLQLSNKDEVNQTSELLSPSAVPPVLARTGKAAIGTRVLPALDPNGDAPPVRLRHFQTTEKKADNPAASDAISTAVDSPDSNEQYKRMSVKERARMLATNIPSSTSNDKKTNTPPANPTGYF